MVGSLGVIISPFQNGEIGSYKYITSVVGPNILAGSPMLIWDLRGPFDSWESQVFIFPNHVCMYVYIYIYTVTAFIVAPVPFYTYLFTFPHHF